MLQLSSFKTTRRAGRCAALLAATWLAACTSTPQRVPEGSALPAPSVPPARTFATDGPHPETPKDLDRTPDAEPRIEPVRQGGPNKPYQVAGEVYVPITDDRAVVESGLASWYGRKFHGRPTASGELYNMFAMTAAHPTLPIPSYARVRNPVNGREVIVRVNDRGPFAKGRIVDLSYTAALKLDILRGVHPVELERIRPDDIRNGRWRSAAAAASEAAAAMATVATEEPLAPGSPIRQRELPGQVLALNGSSAPSNPATTPAPDRSPPAPPDQAPTTTAVPAAPTALPVSAAMPLPLPTAAPAADERVQRDPVRTAAGRGWWVQLGAFRERAGALTFHGEMGRTAPWLAPLLGLFDERGLHKLQAGPFTSKAEAHALMDRTRSALHLTPVLVERR